MHRFPNASSILASDTAASVMVGSTPKRGAISRNKTASSWPHPYIVIPIWAIRLLRLGARRIGPRYRIRLAGGQVGHVRCEQRRDGWAPPGRRAVAGQSLDVCGTERRSHAAAQCTAGGPVTVER